MEDCCSLLQPRLLSQFHAAPKSQREGERSSPAHPVLAVVSGSATILPPQDAP